MNPQILISDDTIFMRTRLRTILSGDGYKDLLEATSGEEAISMYAKHRPNLVFMDLSFPDMDGVTAVRKIKKHDQEARIVVCSSLGQKQLLVEAIKAGALDFLVKPFQSDRVLDSVRKFAA